MSLGLKHYTRRKKAQQSGASSGRVSMLKILLDMLIYPVAIAAPLALVPQVWQLYATHNVSGLSLPTWAALGILNIVWIFYSVVHRERPVLLTNAALMVLNFAIALGTLLYQ